MKRILRVLVLQLVLISSILSQDVFHFNGYASFGTSTVLDGDIAYKTFPNQLDLTQKGEVTYKNNTVLGGKATINFTENLSFVLQGDGRERNEEEDFFNADWIYFKYYTPYDLYFRLGQFKFPLFQSTELTAIGYSRLWSRNPIPFYGLATFNEYEGIDATYNTYYGDYDIELQGSLGYSDRDGRADENGVYNRATADDLKTFAAKVSGDNFWVRAAYLNMTAKQEKVHKNFKEDLGEGDVTAHSLEFEINLENYRIEGGHIEGDVEKHVPNESSQYLSVAYTKNRDFTPYIIQSVRKIDGTSSSVAPANGPLPGSGNLPPVGAVAPGSGPASGGGTGAGPATSGVTGGAGRTETVISLGVRYDIFENTAIKTQLDFFDNTNNNGELVKSTTNGDADGTVLSIVVDMVF